MPDTLPALLRAQRLQVKAGRVGFDWAEWREAWAKVREEMEELETALDAGEQPIRSAMRLGTLLFSMVNVARLQGHRRRRLPAPGRRKFTRRFKEVEAEMRAAGRKVSDASAEDLDRAWEGGEEPASTETRARSGTER